VAQEEIEMAVIVQVTEVAAHGSPAAIDANFARTLGKCAVAIIVIDTRNRAIFGAASSSHGFDDIFVIGPGELHDVEPTVVVVIAPEAGAANHQVGQAGLQADFGKRAVPIVAIKLGASEASFIATMGADGWKSA